MTAAGLLNPANQGDYRRFKTAPRSLSILRHIDMNFYRHPELHVEKALCIRPSTDIASELIRRGGKVQYASPEETTFHTFRNRILQFLPSVIKGLD